MTPDNRKSIPIATVIQVTVLSGNFINMIPMAMAQIARKMELCNIFIFIISKFYAANIIK
jgi:hypothetical protein